VRALEPVKTGGVAWRERSHVVRALRLWPAISVSAGSEPGSHRERWLVATTEYAGLTAYTGGIGRHYAALLPALVRHGVDVDLIVFSDAAPQRNPQLHGVRLVAFHRTDRLSPIRALFASARRVRAVFERFFHTVRTKARGMRLLAGDVDVEAYLGGWL
jgi:hypothetical protein